MLEISDIVSKMTFLRENNCTNHGMQVWESLHGCRCFTKLLIKCIRYIMSWVCRYNENTVSTLCHLCSNTATKMMKITIWLSRPHFLQTYRKPSYLNNLPISLSCWFTHADLHLPSIVYSRILQYGETLYYISIPATQNESTSIIFGPDHLIVPGATF